MALQQLDDSTDVMLMMEFRQENWDEWSKFCKKRGYNPKIKT